ncbi:MAG: MFS transporter [Alphaproteobacteria bacterium]
MAEQATIAPRAARGDRRAMGAACGAHIVHDGFTDVLYVMLPIWQAELGLGYAEVGMLRSAYTGAMAVFQIPAGALAERFGPAVVLALGTVLAGAAFPLAGSSWAFAPLLVALIAGGIGASVQHPIASAMVSRAFEGLNVRTAIGTYNFAGDIGKMLLPAAAALLITVMHWRSAMWALFALGIVAALLILVFAQHAAAAPAAGHHAPAKGAPAPGAAPVARGGFALLLAIGTIDTATRAGFLTFLPFLLTAKSASLPTIGLALTLVFAGGAAGKLICAFIGARFGVLRTVLLTEGLTAVGIVALLPLPLDAGLAVLPLIGVALNGTSSVLYGTVPDLVPADRRTRAFSVFYTGAVGAGAVAPIAYGLFSDAIGVPMTMIVVAALVLATLPLAILLNKVLASQREAAPA